MRFINEHYIDLACVFRERGDRSCDEPECGKQDCMHYVPIAKNHIEEWFLISEWYKRYKTIKDDDLLDAFVFLSARDEIGFNDAYYYGRMVASYILISRKSKYALEKHTLPGQYIDTIELMKKCRFRITKAMYRKYRRLKKKAKISFIP